MQEKRERERERELPPWILLVQFSSDTVLAAMGQASERAGQDNGTAAGRTVADGGTPGQKQGQ